MYSRSIVPTALVLLLCSCVEPPLIADASLPAVERNGIDWGALPEVIDGPGAEAWLTRHPDGRVIVFGRHDKDYKNHRLFVTRFAGDRWSEPEALPFSRDVSATAPHFAPDGRSLLFISSRSLAGEERTGPDREGNVWRVSWDGESWGQPRQLPAQVNSPATEIDAVEVNSGAIYFSSMRPGGKSGLPDLYRAVPEGNGYRVEPLSAFNTEHTESTIYVTPDESLLFFHRQDDPVGLGKDDLFVARRLGTGWGPPIHLGGGVNSAEYEYGPELSRDGSTLYFTTHRSGQGGLMAVKLSEALER